jgi:hypothetical protein
LPEIKEILKFISSINKEIFTYRYFYSKYDKYFGTENKKDRDKKKLKILNILFFYSVIGNIITKEQYYGNKLTKKYQLTIFKYNHKQAVFNFNYPIIVHRGLLKIMQIY